MATIFTSIHSADEASNENRVDPDEGADAITDEGANADAISDEGANADAISYEGTNAGASGDAETNANEDSLSPADNSGDAGEPCSQFEVPPRLGRSFASYFLKPLACVYSLHEPVH